MPTPQPDMNPNYFVLIILSKDLDSHRSAVMF